MLKNKEIRIFLGGQSILATVIVLLLHFDWIPAWVAVVSITVVMILSNLIFTAYRYEEMKRLSLYLVRLQNGEKNLEVRDNSEGELSILKNELYRISVKLNTQTELLLRDKTYLSDALSDISHQLKTPLTSMMMMVELLEENQLPEEKRQEFLRNISIGIERMQWLVQALLKLSKLDADAVILKKEPVDVGELLHAAVAPLLITLELKEIHLVIEKLPERVTMCGDFQWTCEAITNIVKNCIEHTPREGTIRITYSDNNLYTKICIQDSGCGIAPEELPHIFERFYKGTNSKNDSVGIGLALSKEIIHREKGRIEVQSILAEGTSFEIKFYR